MPVTWYDACWARRAGWVLGIQNTVAVKQENKKSAGIRCHIPATVESVNTWPGSHTLCAFHYPHWITFFFIWGREDSVSSLPPCLCRSWLQMCTCRGSLDLRRALVGVLVRTAVLVASCRTLKSTSSPQVFRSPLYSSLFGMTWTQCQILVCGQYCPTLTCHISSVELVCAGPKGNFQNSS